MAHINLNLFVKAHHPHKLPFRKTHNRRLAPGRPSRANEMWYKTSLLALVRFIHKETMAELVPVLKQEVSLSLGDAIPGTVASRIKALSQKFGDVDGTARRLARVAVERNLRTTDDQLIRHIQRAVHINVQATLTNDGIREALLTATKANIDLINSIPTQYFEKVEHALEKNWVTGARWEDLADVLEDVGNVTESRAKLIARDQTSKMNGAFNEARQTSIGIEKYEWQTSGDERVRDTHAANDGKVFNWDEPPAETGHPGEDINCRCVALPIFDLEEEE